MSKEEFREEWDRLVDSLGHRLSLKQITAMSKEAFHCFSRHPADHWKATVTACLRTPGRRWFPTLGELLECFDNTEPAADTMDEETRRILNDPELGERLQEDTQEWFEKEVIPNLEDTPMRKDMKGKADDETEGPTRAIGGSGTNGSTSSTLKH